MKSLEIRLEVKAVHHEKNNSSILLTNNYTNRSVSVEIADCDAKEMAIGDVLYLVSFDRRVPRQGDARKTASGGYEVFDGALWKERKSSEAVAQ